MAEWNDGTSAAGERALGQVGKSEPEDAAAIRAGINETRERLSDTLSELGERLNPHVVKEQVTERVKEGIREATIGRVEHMARSAANSVNSTRSGITATVRDNPVPAAMVAIGLAWMMFNGKRESSTDYSRRYDEFGDGDDTRNAGPYARSSTFAGSYPYDRDYSETDAEGRVSRVVGDVRERVSSAAGNVADTVKDRAGDLAERGRDAAGNVASKARNVSRSVVDRTSRGARRIEDTFYENPLAIGAVTVAVGVMAGLAVPRTDREVALMGDARERVADKVRDVAHEATDKARHVAERVVDETKRVVQEEGVSLGGSKGTGTDSLGAYAPNPS